MMQIQVALFGGARVVTGAPTIDLAFDDPSITLNQVIDSIIARYPRARPYLLDASGSLPPHIRVLINQARPQPDATLSTPIHDGDEVALLVAVAGG
ncbi:MAG TPA: MoaD/ThiS family protein [Ktedonobacteraceae bacterium]|nr:MoaD/ThiS family protein [Ktedonobacteraceae bacterium]